MTHTFWVPNMTPDKLPAAGEHHKESRRSLDTHSTSSIQFLVPLFSSTSFSVSFTFSATGLHHFSSFTPFLPFSGDNANFTATFDNHDLILTIPTMFKELCCIDSFSYPVVNLNQRCILCNIISSPFLSSSYWCPNSFWRHPDRICHNIVLLPNLKGIHSDAPAPHYAVKPVSCEYWFICEEYLIFAHLCLISTSFTYLTDIPAQFIQHATAPWWGLLYHKNL